MHLDRHGGESISDAQLLDLQKRFDFTEFSLDCRKPDHSFQLRRRSRLRWLMYLQVMWQNIIRVQHREIIDLQPFLTVLLHPFAFVKNRIKHDAFDGARIAERFIDAFALDPLAQRMHRLWG